MVPELLSSNLCSLRSNVERYVLIEYAVQISTIDTVVEEIKIKKSFNWWFRGGNNIYWKFIRFSCMRENWRSSTNMGNNIFSEFNTDEWG